MEKTLPPNLRQPSPPPTRQQTAFQRVDLCPGSQTFTKAADTSLSVWTSCYNICGGLDLGLPALGPLSKPALRAKGGTWLSGFAPPLELMAVTFLPGSAGA